MDMYLVKTGNGGNESTYEAAVIEAKRRAQGNEEDATIFKAVAVVKYPVPDYEVQVIE